MRGWPVTCHDPQLTLLILVIISAGTAAMDSSAETLGITHKLDEQFEKHQVSEFSMEWNPNVELSNYNGKLCAFVDVNGDQYTDIITTSSNGKNFSVHEASIEDFSFTKKQSVSLPKPLQSQKIQNCAVGDFDGDSYPDILLSTSSDNSLINSVSVCFGGRGGSFSCDYTHTFEESCGQPSVLDFNLDFKSDFYVPLSNGSSLCYAHVNRTSFSPSLCLTDAETLIIADFMHSYVDLDQDYNAEFIQPVAAKDKDYPVGLQVWKMVKGEWMKKKDFLPALNKKGGSPQLMDTGTAPAAFGYPILGDFDADGWTDVLVPICADKYCSQVSFLSWNQMSSTNKQWMTVKLHLNQSETAWRLSGAVAKSVVGPKSLSILDSRIQVGDYTLDGFPDLLLILESEDAKKKNVFLAENVGCRSGESCGGWTRRLEIKWSFQLVSGGGDKASVSRAAFFDLAEDGNLDIILGYSTKDSDTFRFLKSEDKGDTSFMKAEVFTGTCGGGECGNGYRIGGSGVSAPGGTLLYEILDAEGKSLQGIHGQLSQSSHNSLQLPYALFGMGRTPNFVEKLTVGIPQNVSSSKSWIQIVPNARLYVIPFPPGSPGRWKSKLYVTPSRLILLSFAALCCVCGVILLMIVLLHWRERRQDKREKQQQAHKFNFDAM